MQIFYFPHLQLQDTNEIIIGNVKIWKFSANANNYISNTALREKVKSLLYINTFQGKAIEDIPVISIKNIDFRIFTEAEIKQINDARNLLFLAFISVNNILDHSPNQGHYMATSENFEIINQSFEMSKDTLSTRNGILVNKIDFGNKISEIKFEYPLQAPRPIIFSIDEDLICQMLLLKKKDKELFEKIISASEIFYESYFNTENLSCNARILLGAGAFEMLLGTHGNARKEIKQKVREMLYIRGKEKRVSFLSERENGKIRESGSIKIMWADRFFSLRNHIIHGDKVNIKKFKFKNIQAHFHITPIFFIAFIHQLINTAISTKEEKVFYSILIAKN